MILAGATIPLIDSESRDWPISHPSRPSARTRHDEPKPLPLPGSGLTLETTVNRKHVDVVVGIVLVGIVLAGVLTAVQVATTDGGPMGEGSGVVMRLVGPVIGSLVMASILGAAYVVVRSHVFETGSVRDGPPAEPAAASESPAAGTGAVEDEDGDEDDVAAEPERTAVDRQILDILPADERKILEPVLETPGLTQIAIRDRSGFSKSKVSQTVTDLEERGLLYRERQGRTYRVYPADDIQDRA